MRVEPISDFTSLSEEDQTSLPLFTQDRWVHLYEGKCERYGVFNKGERPIAIFHLLRGEKMRATFGLNAPLTPSCGLVMFDRSKKRSSQQTFEKNVHSAIAKYIDGLKLSVIDFNLPVGIKDTQPYHWSDFEVSPRYTYLLDLKSTEETLMSSMSASKRQNINKGLKDELRIEQASNADDVFALIKKTFDSKNEAFHEDVLKQILKSDALKGSRFACIAHYNDKPSAVVLVVHDKEKAYYLLGGYDRENSHEGSGSLAMWNAIMESKRRGLKEFDFLGSMIPEVERYIRGFGGELTPFYSISKRSIAADIFMRITGRG